MNPARILIVEDDRIVARDIEQQLRRLGYLVTGITARGDMALALAQSTQADLVLMDIRVQGPLDGIEAARQIRAHCQIPVVFLTAYADDDTVRRASAAEPYGYVLKPFEDSQLHTVIGMALYKHTSEQRLRASEQRYAVTLASIGDAVIATDSALVVTFLNPAAARLTGWPVDEALGQPIAAVFDVQGGADLDTVLAGGVAVTRASASTLHGRDRTARVIDETIAPIVDARGVASGVVLVFRDVTARRAAEHAQAMADAEQNWRTLTESLPHLIWVSSATGVSEFFSPQCYAFLGVTEQELLGTGLWLAMLHPDDRVHAAADWEYAMRRVVRYDSTFRLRRHDGVYRWFNSVGVPVHDATGGLAKWYGTATDTPARNDHPMRLSKSLLPVMKESPADAQIVSHKLMLRAGLVRQTAAGIYAWLPLGLRVLRNIERIVREEQNRAGAIELLMPTLQSAELWRQSGRYDAYGPEMLRITDRHDREMLYGPTNEEMITALFRDAARSYRDLPRTLYHVQWKFRDEIRPRFGVMRGREFLMKDAYSFDLDEAGARHSYNRMFVAYLNTFARMGLRAIPMQADTGPIGGDLSHEFIVLAPTGESDVFYHANWERPAALSTIDFEDVAGLQSIVAGYTADYAATDEKRDPAREAAAGADLRQSRGVEVGHIFYFGTKYSAAMGLKVQAKDGSEVVPQMGSYGIGVSRLVGAIIEASHDDAGIVWPDAVAPYAVALINMRADDAACTAAADDLYAQLQGAGIEVLYDDRDERGGAKFATADLIGLPWQIVVGPKGLAKGVVEVKRRVTGEKTELPVSDALALVAA